MLGEALTAEDDAAVLQELEELESIETREEAAQLPAAPKVLVLHASNNPAHDCLASPCPCQHVYNLESIETTDEVA